MTASLRVLLQGIIDYAGLFPPAQLPLEQAVRNYACFWIQPESWMLGRLICPATRLIELEPFVEELFRDGPPLALSALGRGGKNTDEFLSAVHGDLQAIATFNARWIARAGVDVLELRLPTELSSDWFGGFAGVWENNGDPALTPFFEASADAVRRTTSDIQDGIRLAPTSMQPAGVKLRCGGLEASAFPTVEQVASAIVACRDAGVPLKFTAGLHHPIRLHDESLRTTMHGFLNLFVAGVLAHAHALTQSQVECIVADEEPRHFHFHDDALAWKDFRAPVEEIRRVRQQRLISFGSCSFDEPCEDLRALGLLT